MKALFWTSWIVVLLGTAGLAAHAVEMGDLGCEAEHRDSVYGERSWSVVPPGPVCTWTEEANGFDRQEGPHPAWSLSLTYLVAGPFAFTWWHRRRATAGAEAPEPEPEPVGSTGPP